MARRDTLTPDLFAWQPPKVAAGYGEDVTGRGALDNRIARTISRAMKDAKERGLTRSQIAKAMSDYLGRSISEDMLNKWASEAADSNRITLDAFMALIDATGSHDLMGLVVSGFGYVAVPERYSDMIELHLIEEHERDVIARRQALEARVRAKR
ncbi:hypothetical protein [Agrobacterium vitis]|uniref:hypothetical protein n=1 Tax=Agrobacterium vitis TaxID=373 RepID=UPI0015764478|nr:hypothetical protein G6L01_021005 [Agrobacterium vitis]